MIGYLDTSAAMKLVIAEAESAALSTYLRSPADRLELVASWWLHTELHCTANRHPDLVSAEAIALVLDTVLLVDLTRGDLLTAGALPGRLRSHDAIHLAAALRVGADAMITYDDEVAAAAVAAGLTVLRPGR